MVWCGAVHTFSHTTGKMYSYPISFGQVPVLVIFVLKYSLLRNFELLLSTSL